jgi:hypothetical protein
LKIATSESNLLLAGAALGYTRLILASEAEVQASAILNCKIVQHKHFMHSPATWRVWLRARNFPVQPRVEVREALFYWLDPEPKESPISIYTHYFAHRAMQRTSRPPSVLLMIEPFAVAASKYCIVNSRLRADRP